MLICAAPVPDKGDTDNHFVVALEGDIDTVQAGAPPLKVSASVELPAPLESATLIVTAEGETEGVTGEEAGALKEEFRYVLTVPPESVTPLI